MTTASTLVRAESTEPSARPQQPPQTKTVRVLHVINGEHYSGAERVQDLLAGRLPEAGFEVGLACVKPDQFPRVCETWDAPLYRVPMKSRFDLRCVGRLKRIVRSERYQLLHAHSPRTLLVAALASLWTGVPLVYHVHSPTSRDSTHPWRNRINALVEWFGLLVASAVIAVSNSLAGHVRALGFSGRKVSVVPNGVPCRAPRSVRPAGWREWTLGTVALFRPRKGVEILLEALAKLRSQGLPVRLRAVGGFETSDYEDQVKRLVDELGLADAVDWTGFRHDVDRELERIDLFVLPSLFGEGLPMVVLEAMAAGVPVVATQVEGIPEAIRDGQDGVLAEPADPHSLAWAIARVVCGEADWHGLRDSALERQAEKFSDRSMADGVASVYRRVLSP
jgi:glycosyltransferase involved in cell wall biosynthesis